MVLEALGTLGIPFAALLLMVFYGWSWWLTVFNSLLLYSITSSQFVRITSLGRRAIEYERAVLDGPSRATEYPRIVRLVTAADSLNRIGYLLFFVSIGGCFFLNTLPSPKLVEESYVYYDASEGRWKESDVSGGRTLVVNTPWKPRIYSAKELRFEYLQPVCGRFDVRIQLRGEYSAKAYASCLNSLEAFAASNRDPEQLLQYLVDSKIDISSVSL